MSNNPFKTPEEIYKHISADFAILGMKKKEAASRLGITPQSLYNLFASRKYLSMKQAEKFRGTFGYRINYLTMGEGSLYDTPEGDKEENKPPKEQNKDTNKNQADIQLTLQWMHTMLQRQNNQEGLAVLAEIARFHQAKNIVQCSMRYYNGNNYEKDFKNKLYTLESQIINTIESKIETIEIATPKPK